MGLVRMSRTAVVAGTATAVSDAWRGVKPRDMTSRTRSSMRSRRRLRPRREDDATAQLQNLAQLHAQGVLTDEEFAAAKAKALGI